MVQQIDDIGIHLADEHHFGDLHRLAVRDPKPAHELGLLADLLQEARDIRAAAMHDDRADADVFHEGDILHDLRLQLIADHGVAAVFDDDCLAGKFLYIGQRLNEDVCCILG